MTQELKDSGCLYLPCLPTSSKFFNETLQVQIMAEAKHHKIIPQGDEATCVTFCFCAHHLTRVLDSHVTVSHNDVIIFYGSLCQLLIICQLFVISLPPRCCPSSRILSLYLTSLLPSLPRCFIDVFSSSVLVLCPHPVLQVLLPHQPFALF